MTLFLLLFLLGCRSTVDADGDGWRANQDCDDLDASRNPGQDEICNGIDDNCDGAIDEDSALDAPVWYVDLDLDGYGQTWTALNRCEKPAGYVAVDGDCDDDDPDRSPDGTEVCNGLDDDCDGDSDEGSAVDAGVWYLDDDGDGYGDAAQPIDACEQPDGYVSNDRDCNDGDASVQPGVVDDPDNRVDDDCDGAVDEATLWLDELDTASQFVGQGEYGSALAVGDLDGDGQQELTVGAPAAGADDQAAGAVSVMGAVNLTLTGQFDLDRAGAALAVSDVDGDGYDDLLVGADQAETVGIEAGAVYLLAGPLTASGAINALQVGKLKAEDPYDHLGGSLAVSGGLVAIGAEHFDYDGVGPRTGAAYVVEGLPEDTEEAGDYALAVRMGALGSDQAGAAVGLGDITGDGLSDLVTGAPGTGLDAGAVWLTEGPLSGVTELSDDLGLFGENEGDGLGGALAIVGDVDGDGISDILVGAPGHSAGGELAGAAVVVDGASWTVQATLIGLGEGALAGTAVAGGGDLEADGGVDLVVGSPGAPAVHLVVAQPVGTVLLGGAALTLHGRDLEQVGAAVLIDDALGLVLGDPASDQVWRLDPGPLLP